MGYKCLELPEFMYKYLNECSCVYLRRQKFHSFRQILERFPNPKMVNKQYKKMLFTEIQPTHNRLFHLGVLVPFSSLAYLSPRRFLSAQTWDKPEQFFTFRASGRSPVSYKLQDPFFKGQRSPRVNYFGVPCRGHVELKSCAGLSLTNGVSLPTFLRLSKVERKTS